MQANTGKSPENPSQDLIGDQTLRASPGGLHAPPVRGSLCDGYDVEGLRLNEPGEDGADEPGVVLAVAEAVPAAAEMLEVATTADGLQWPHVKTLKPRPPQLVQIPPLEI
ncbi:uncharacterized protein N7473_007295 [Penicillium subrubescens]|uniref:uncharacterized protein n=1 Tax=Penicillium subrubescens TaxID=1316194 RepID=UPI002545A6CF|nr:uncharacterized protein N7473_007295 [Penicillium subrubescens]KAJ5891067.1 hypothetical protein N7473_007295 [Penicillium subrubescens]